MARLLSRGATLSVVLLVLVATVTVATSFSRSGTVLGAADVLGVLDYLPASRARPESEAAALAAQPLLQTSRKLLVHPRRVGRRGRVQWRQYATGVKQEASRFDAYFLKRALAEANPAEQAGPRSNYLRINSHSEEESRR